MATSGSYDYSLTAAGIIAAAYEDLGVIEPGGTVSSANSTMALTRLNLLAKQLPGTHSWMKPILRQRVTLFLAKGQQKYLVGPASTDSRATTAYGRTTLSAAEAAGQTTISITSNTDTTTDPGTTVTMTASDFVGIELDDGTLHWSTISGTPTTTMTIVDSLASAAASGNYVWWFTSRAQRFTDVESAVLHDENRNDTELSVFRNLTEYEGGVSDKYADGDPSWILVEPLRITTRVTLDSQPTDVTKQIVLTVLYPVEDYDATTDDIAFPQEALAYLSWELAFRLSPSVGRWTPQMQANYLNSKSLAMTLNPEVTDAYFRPGGL